MPDYLIQCACFHCRKSFKRRVTDWEFGPKCPDCGSATHVMGRYFRAPSVRATKQWRKVEMLYQAGVRFSGSQSWELGRFPDTLLEARAFIRRNQSTLAANQVRSAHVRAQAIREERDEQRRAERRRIQTARRKAQQKT